MKETREDVTDRNHEDPGPGRHRIEKEACTGATKRRSVSFLSVLGLPGCRNPQPAESRPAAGRLSPVTGHQCDCRIASRSSRRCQIWFSISVSPTMPLAKSDSTIAATIPAGIESNLSFAPSHALRSTRLQRANSAGPNTVVGVGRLICDPYATLTPSYIPDGS